MNVLVGNVCARVCVYLYVRVSMCVHALGTCVNVCVCVCVCVCA